MFLTSLRVRLVVAALATVVVGCSGDDSNDASGSAPVISNLTYTPSTLKVGKQSVVEGKLTFEDPDADVVEIAIEVTSPGASSPQAMPSQKINAGGVAKSELGFSLAAVVPAAGDYEFTVRVVDGQGHDSNRLSGTLHAE